MLDNKQKKQYREELFRHLDGIVTAPIAYSLYNEGVTSYIQQHEAISLADLVKTFNANEGYLNVALRTLAAQGWLDYTVKNELVTIKTNATSPEAFSLFPLYKGVVDLIQLSGNYHPRKFELEPFYALEKLFDAYEAEFNLSTSDASKELKHQVLMHIEGVLIGPTIVRLGMGGMFHKYFMEASFTADEYHQHPESFDKILTFLSNRGWFIKNDKHYSFTEKGLFFAKRAAAYGVTVSYIPMFRKIEELIFGNPKILWEHKSEDEIHVDREMNVWGSGGAHAAYFKKIDEIIIDLFNKPLEEQPKGILDMGCGNGAFLIHLFDTIESKTLRGKHLDEHPLFLVGADFNTAALKVTRANIIQADIWAKVIWGDIGNPDQLQKDLQENYKINLKDLLSVRTFLDHNRVWKAPELSLDTPSTSTGAFAYRGKRLHNTDVERNLKDHFSKWAPYIRRFGLIVIELHTIAPSLTADNLGKTAATAYDATHGFSDQYILEIESFLKVIQEIGLQSDPKHFAKFPDSELATVSINYIRE
ncbi:class I SAM-dependent methyltransferase [Aquimarina brevivitae]|uniref:N-6 DNA methylase n=1 Tax=Aquimarina brevivitae TaxID=323412 RepID=A0A4Q7PI85_9FLAO|nr:class I SAM-dependent methyltransferase [Aquimarina brevivitae]RZT00324.1 N-6 DNA methylase [Aquimarina brevivitae]